MTGTEWITNALREIGVLGAVDPLSGEDADLGFDWANRMIDAWGTEKLLIYYILRTTRTLSASTATYTIGTGGTINIARPVFIEAVKLVQDTGAATPLEMPVAIFTIEQWAAIAQKTLAGGFVEGIYYDRNWSAGLALINVYPVPNVGTTQLVLYTGQALTQLANLSTDYTFPPGYEEALHYNLALRLLGPFQVREVPPLLSGLATRSKAAIKTPNLIIPELVTDPFVAGRTRYDILSGRVR